MKTRFALSRLVVVLLYLNGCGAESNFTGNGGQSEPNGSDGTITDNGVINPGSRPGGKNPGGKGPNNSTTTPEPVGPVGDGFELSWLWPCDSEVITPDMPEGIFHKVINGEGNHSVSRNDFDNSKIYFKGRSCDVSQRQRNVVFVVDVSYSMRLQQDQVTPGYDPMVNGTCGRMEAVRSIINAGSGDVRYGIVTFDKNLQAHSSALFASKDDLFNDLVSGSSFSTIEQVLCAGIDGTNYDKALVEAKNLLDTSSLVASQREIYFLSDGEPATGDEGRAIAATLREDTTIASVMIGDGTDTVLKNDIASKDSDGVPLHRRSSDINDLTNTLIGLSKNYIAEASLIFNGETIDFTSSLNNNEFAIGGYVLDADATPGGVEVEFRYRDRFDTVQTKSGRLNWVD